MPDLPSAREPFKTGGVMDQKLAVSGTVVSVTYGTRVHLLKQVVLAVDRLCPQIQDMVIVDNASQGDLRSLRDCVVRLRLHILREEVNRGSAFGFARGIRFAVDHTESDFIWLLDDDNRPEPGALSALLHVIEANGGLDVCTAFSFRPSEGGQASAMAAGRYCRARSNSFYYFHWRDIPQKLGRLFSARETPTPISPDTVLEAYEAPYGGFLFAKKWVDRVGLPDAELFLYYDDVDFTWRFVKAGARLVHAGASVVTDLEPGWYAGRRGNPLFFSRADEFRVWFAVRNRVFLERRDLVTSAPMYLLNVMISCLANSVLAIIREGRPLLSLRRLALIVKAASAGWKGQLGPPARDGWPRSVPAPTTARHREVD